jgi:O-antigen ligase
MAMLTKAAKGIWTDSRGLTQAAVAGLVGLVLGAACLLISPQWTLLGIIGLIVVVAMLKRAEIGVLGILVYTASFIQEEQWPLVPIGVGSLHLSDLVLLSLLGIIVLRRLLEPDFKLARTPLDGPLLAFWAIAALATFLGVAHGTVETTNALRGIRFISYYLTFFVVTNLVRQERQIRLLRWGFLLIGTISAAAMAGQAVLGNAIPLLKGVRVETLTVQGASYAGVTRIVIPGLSLIIVGFMVVTVTFALNRFRAGNVLGLLQWGLLTMGLILTFLRSYWAVMGAMLLLFFALTGRSERWRLVIAGIAAGLTGAVIVLAVLTNPESTAARFVSGAFDRLFTLTDAATAQEDSLRWRYMENGYALRQIAAQPVFGLGLRARYRPFDPVWERYASDEDAFDSRRHIHNGHLGMLVTTGLAGYLPLMGLSALFIVRGLQRWRSVLDPQLRGMVLAFTLAYLGVVIAAFANSTFMQWYWTPVIGTMMGMNEVIYRRGY